MRFLILIILATLVYPTFGQENQDKLLRRAFEEKSKDQLRLFFKTWSTERPPITNEELDALNDTLREAYRVFQSFYQPKDIDQIGGSEWGNGLYKNSEYLIVQSKIKIGFTNTLNRDSIIRNNVKKAYRTDTALQNKLLKKVDGKYSDETIESFSQIDRTIITDSISDFRPQIDNAVFLNDYYTKVLNRFLGNKYYKLGTGGIMNPARAKGESKVRLDFINQIVTIFHGHWGGYWVLISQPIAYDIIFDNSMKNALIHYQMVYEGGEAHLVRQANNRWAIVEARRTWIE